VSQTLAGITVRWRPPRRSRTQWRCWYATWHEVATTSTSTKTNVRPHWVSSPHSVAWL